jgi:hypothetical protein
LDPWPELPSVLVELYKKDDFIMNLRGYNSIFSFTSLGAEIDTESQKSKYPIYFRISGQVHHRIGSLLPSTGTVPKYSQIYIYDTLTASSLRSNAFGNLNQEYLSSIEIMLKDINPFAQVYRHVGSLIEQNPGIEYQLILREAECTSRNLNGQYAKPTADELACIIHGTNPEDSMGRRDIIIRKNNSSLLRISEIHHAYDPLGYPLLFPYGTSGYRPQISYESPKPSIKKDLWDMIQQMK